VGLLVGCAARDERLKVYPVSGKVLVAGQPAAGAEVALHRQTPLKDALGRPIVPHARCAADGSFKLTSYVPDDGAPEGTFQLTVEWPIVTTEGGEETSGQDRLQGRFRWPKHASVATIEPHENELGTINLK
jgi:hypothetical protein